MTTIVEMSALRPSGSSARIFEGADHDGVDVSFFIVNAPPGEGPRLHAHPYQEVFVVEEGVATFTVGDATVEVEGGRIVVAPANVPHAFVNSGTGMLRTVNIHPAGRIAVEWLDET